MSEKKSKLWIVVAIAVFGAVAWFFFNNREEIDAFADGITGNQAVRESQEIESQVRSIREEQQRRLDEVTGKPPR